MSNTKQNKAMHPMLNPKLHHNSAKTSAQKIFFCAMRESRVKSMQDLMKSGFQRLHNSANHLHKFCNRANNCGNRKQQDVGTGLALSVIDSVK